MHLLLRQIARRKVATFGLGSGLLPGSFFYAMKKVTCTFFPVGNVLCITFAEFLKTPF